jgi:hypothetical protein
VRVDNNNLSESIPASSRQPALRWSEISANSQNIFTFFSEKNCDLADGSDTGETKFTFAHSAFISFLPGESEKGIRQASLQQCTAHSRGKD